MNDPLKVVWNFTTKVKIWPTKLTKQRINLNWESLTNKNSHSAQHMLQRSKKKMLRLKHFFNSSPLLRDTWNLINLWKLFFCSHFESQEQFLLCHFVFHKFSNFFLLIFCVYKKLFFCRRLLLLLVIQM